jgi:hypothetical protein
MVRLLLLKQRAWLRHFLGTLVAPRRALGVLAMLGLVSFAVWQSWSGVRGGLARESLAVLGALVYLMSVSSGFVQQGPRFTPADVDFLFPAPFSPRHLLVWRLVQLWPLTAFSTLFMALMFGARLESPARFLVGMFLLQATALHVQLLVSVLMTLAGDALARRLRGAARALVTIALFSALAYLVFALSLRGGVSSAVAPLVQAPLTRFLFFPAADCVDFVFGETPRATGFALLRLLLGTFGTLGLLFLPDVDFREDSVATTARAARLLAARRRTGAAVDLEEGRRARSGAVPAARLLFRSSGAIVWKNLLVLLRSWKAVLPSLLVGLALVLPIVFATRNTSLEPAAGALLPVVMLTLFCSNALSFDLRRETDRLDQLRALPLPSTAIVFSELLLPWALVVALQESLIVAITLSGRGENAGLGLLALALPVLAFLWVEIDNLAVFVFATRSQAGAARGSVSSSSPAQMLRLLGWFVVAVPGVAAGMWVREATDSTPCAVAGGVAVEVALAAALFALLVRWYETRDVEAAE